MKKIVILLLILLLPLTTLYKTYASEIETEEVDITETLKSGIWTGEFEGQTYYVKTNLIEIDFNQIKYLGVASFEFKENTNAPVVKSAKIEISKNNVVQHTINVPKTDYGFYNEFIISDFSLVQYKGYKLNLKFEIDNSTSILGSNGGALKIQYDPNLFALQLVVVKDMEYFPVNPVDPSNPQTPVNPEDLGEVVSFHQLPLTTTGFAGVEDKSKVGQVKFYDGDGGRYHVQVTYNNRRYVVLNVELPSVRQLRKAPINSAVYYTEGGERFLYYEFQNDPSEEQLSENLFYDRDARINGFRPFTIWNLTTGEYQSTNKLRLYGTVHIEEKKAYVDVLFPMAIDDLLSITFNYKYQYKYFVAKGDVLEANITRIKGESVRTKNFWSHLKDQLFMRDTWSWLGGNVNLIWDMVVDEDWENTLVNITNKATDVIYQNNYINKLNPVLVKNGKPTVDRSIFSANSLYRVYLNTFDYGLSTSFEIFDNYSIVDVMYEFEGELFHVVMDDIEFDGAGGTDRNDSHLKPDSDKIARIVFLVVVGLTFVGSIFTGALFRRHGLKNLLMIIIFEVGIYLLWVFDILQKLFEL